MANPDTDGSITGLRSALLGSRRRVFGAGMLSLLLVFGVAVGSGVVGMPEMTGIQSEFASVNDSTTVIESRIGVHNPNPVGGGFLGLTARYNVKMNDVQMARGSTSDVPIPPGNSTVLLETRLDNDRIPPWWVSHVRNDEVTKMRVNGTARSTFLDRSTKVERTRTIRTDILSAFNSTETREIDANSPVVDDPLLYVNETRAQWGEVTEDRTAIVLDFYVYNPKSYAIPLSRLNYTIGMNDVQVGEGETTDEKVLPPKEETRIRTVTYIDNSRLDEWWVTHVERDQVTDVVIDFGATFEVAGQRLTVPLEGLTYEQRFETDLFGTKNETASANETAGDDGSEDDEVDATTADDADGDSTTAGGSDGSTTGDGSDDEETTTDDGIIGVVAAEATTDLRR